jgi:pantetheine-phosphate adenylyltransferase
VGKELKRAIYSGTFDPITKGHVDIIRRSADVFDEVIVAVAVNERKGPMFSIEKRVEMAVAATKHLPNVKVESFDTLLAFFAKDRNIKYIVRGLRAVSDFEYELQMGYANSSINSEIDTVYFMPNLKNAFVSSTVVREIIRYGGDFSHLVPEEILSCM